MFVLTQLLKHVSYCDNSIIDYGLWVTWDGISNEVNTIRWLIVRHNSDDADRSKRCGGIVTLLSSEGLRFIYKRRPSYGLGQSYFSHCWRNIRQPSFTTLGKCETRQRYPIAFTSYRRTAKANMFSLFWFNYNLPYTHIHMIMQVSISYVCLFY